MLYVMLRGILLIGTVKPVPNCVGEGQFDVSMAPVIVTSIFK